MKQNQVMCGQCDYLLHIKGRNFCAIDPPKPTLVHADEKGNVSVLNMRPEINDVNEEFCSKGTHTPFKVPTAANDEPRKVPPPPENLEDILKRTSHGNKQNDKQ